MFSAQAGLLAGARPQGGAELAAPAYEPMDAPLGLLVTSRESATTAYRGGGQLEAQDLEIRFKWRDSSALPFGTVMSMILGLAVLIPVLALTRTRTGGSNVEFAVVCAVLLLIASYAGLAIVMNETIITVAEGRLRVRSGPVPWRPSQDLAVGSIEQIFCEQRFTDRGGSAGVEIIAFSRNGKRVKVGPSVGIVEHAIFIEDTLERLLRIEDRPVEGEAKYRKR